MDEACALARILGESNGSESAAWYQDIHSDVYLATSEGTFIRQEKMDNAFDQVLFEFLAKCLAEVA